MVELAYNFSVQSIGLEGEAELSESIFGPVSQSTPLTEGPLDPSFGSFINSQDDTLFALDNGGILNEVNRLFDESFSGNVRRKSLLESRAELEKLQDNFLNNIETCEASAEWSTCGETQPSPSASSSSVTLVGSQSNLSVVTDSADIPRESLHGTMDNSQGMKIDPMQFKSLFDGCFESALRNPVVINILKSALLPELNGLRAEVAEVNGSMQYLNSKIEQCELNIESMRAYKSRIMSAESSVLKLSREVVSVNQLVDNADVINMGAKLVALEDKIAKLDTDLHARIIEQENNPTSMDTGGQANVLQAQFERSPVFQALHDKVNMLETNSNLKYLLIDGIIETENEDLPARIVAELHGVMNPPVKLGEIENARRVGNARPGQRPRTIICQFVYASVAQRIYLNRMQLARAKKAIYLSEYLTKEQARLFYLARQERGPDKLLSRAWTFRGQVYVSKSRLSKGTLVRNEHELREFLELPPIVTADEPQEPLPGVPGQ